MSADNIAVKDVSSSDFHGLARHYFEMYDEVEQDASFGLVFFDEEPSLLDEMAVFAEDLRACAEGDAVGSVAESEGAIVGFCYFWRRRPKTAVSHRGAVYASAKKEFRGKGVGTMLPAEMVKRCKGRFEILSSAGMSL